MLHNSNIALLGTGVKNNSPITNKPSMQPQFFEPINVKIPKEKIYKRLGYKKGITQVLNKQRNEFKIYIEEAFSLLKLRASAVRVTIKKKNARRVTLSNGAAFNSKLLASLVKDSHAMLFMGVTAGSKIIDAINSNQSGNLTRAVVYDALASEYADAGFEWLGDYFNRVLSPKAKQITLKRISCGYGDFSLKYQKTMYDILELKKLGISINDEFMLMPEKSATAVAGIISSQ